LKTTIKSLYELNDYLQNNIFEEFKLVNEDEKKRILFENGIEINRVYEGVYNKDINRVEIKFLKNPFTKRTLCAQLISNESTLKDGAKIKVFLSYLEEGLHLCEPQNIFQCESVRSVRRDFNRVKGIPLVVEEDNNCKLIILDAYLTHFTKKEIIQENDLTMKLSNLLCMDEKNIIKKIKKFDKIINDYAIYKIEAKGQTQTRIIKYYKLFCNNIEEYKLELKKAIKAKKAERELDIVDTFYPFKTSKSVYVENTNRKFRVDIDNFELEILKKYNILVFMAKQKEHTLTNKAQFHYFCTIPENRVCNLYCNDFLVATVTLSKEAISVHRTGMISRKLTNISYFIDKPPRDSKKEAGKSAEINKNKKNVPKNDHNKSKKEVAKDIDFCIEKKYTNPAVNELKNNSRRIEFTNIKTYDVFRCFDLTKAIKEIQLIRSMRNHVTLGHTIENKTASLVYYDFKEKKYVGLKVVLHYCVNCHQYFDFYESFIGQLRKNGIKKSGLILRFFDDHLYDISFDSVALREHSKLNLFGYKVGFSGLEKAERQNLLEYLIRERYMAPEEIKNHLEFLIDFRGNAQNMEYSKMCWKEDIDYVNEVIIKSL